MHEKEKRICQERTTEASRKNLLGLEGKFGTILKFLGKSIINHEGGNYFQSNQMPDYLELEDEEEEMPTVDEDANFFEVGIHFDALSAGIHMEIIYLGDEKELKLIYRGREVYKEIAGDLVCYVPSNEWEEKVEYFFQIAKKKELKLIETAKIENKQTAERKRWELLNHLSKMWGL